jgi:hypothetical protein
MQARKLIEDADHAPETLAVVSEAFERAWREIQVGYARDATRKEARVRLVRLAGIILMLARDKPLDAERLESAALKVMSREGG